MLGASAPIVNQPKLKLVRAQRKTLLHFLNGVTVKHSLALACIGVAWKNWPHGQRLEGSLLATGDAISVAAVMPIENSAKSGPKPQDGLCFHDSLRDSFVSGLVVLQGAEQAATLTPRAEQILGLPPSQGAAMQIAQLPKQLVALAREVSASGQPVLSRALELEPSSPGAAVAVGVSALPVQSGGKHCAVAVILSDLSPGREFEHHLEMLDRLANVGTLAASMAHEIKNALVAGRTFIDLLLEKHQDTELVEVVRREIGRIDSIVSRMLKCSASTGAPFGPVPLHVVLEHALRLVQPQLDSKGIYLNRTFQTTDDTVHGDEYQLQQAILNLLLNALEAMDHGGTLSLSSELVAGKPELGRLRDSADPLVVRITIKDTGVGIAQENIGRLFEPFFTTKPTGTGLGLAVTRRILQQHQGEITVESQPGAGAAFCITLPLWNKDLSNKPLPPLVPTCGMPSMPDQCRP